MKRVLTVSLLFVVLQASGQRKPDDNVFKAASDSAMRNTTKQLASELSKLTDLSEMNNILKELQNNVVSEKELFSNRLYRRAYRQRCRIK